MSQEVFIRELYLGLIRPLAAYIEVDRVNENNMCSCEIAHREPVFLIQTGCNR